MEEVSMSTYDGPGQGTTAPMPPQPMYPPQYGQQYGYGIQRPQWRGMIETKPFFLTSEFFGPLLAIIAMSIGVATADNFDAPRYWTLIAVIVSAYVISRGIAKSGTKSRAADPREDMNLFDRGDSGHNRS
jgi:hypothetical protein